MTETKDLRKPLSGEVPVSRIIDPLVRKGELYHRLPNKQVQCFACGHRCKINPNGRGVCQVRYNLDGELYVPWGYVVGLQSDPIEKKPFFHVFPGSDALTFGMLGCDFHCSYCQNWDTSQALRDAKAGRPPLKITSQELVAFARRNQARCIASSYNEPLITSEWAVDIFRRARDADLTCLYVSNGNVTREVLQYIQPYTRGYKIDLKTMNDRRYRQLGGVLDVILNGIRMIFEMGFWTEIVTLIVPGFNDSDSELRQVARFIHSISPAIPWHVTAFHKDYRMTDPDNTAVQTLIQACETGYEEGLHFVYAGNRPGQVGNYENTNCPHCGALLIKRFGYIILEYHLTDTGHCHACNQPIPGIWPNSSADVRTESIDDLHQRIPRLVL